jgi:hypothetical protein
VTGACLSDAWAMPGRDADALICRRSKRKQTRGEDRRELGSWPFRARVVPTTHAVLRKESTRVVLASVFSLAHSSLSFRQDVAAAVLGLSAEARWGCAGCVFWPTDAKHAGPTAKHGWKMRWFTLNGNYLRYFKKEGDTADKELGCIQVGEEKRLRCILN